MCHASRNGPDDGQANRRFDQRKGYPRLHLRAHSKYKPAAVYPERRIAGRVNQRKAGTGMAGCSTGRISIGVAFGSERVANRVDASESEEIAAFRTIRSDPADRAVHWRRQSTRSHDRGVLVTI